MKPTKNQRDRLRRIRAGAARQPDDICSRMDAGYPNGPMEDRLYSNGWIELVKDERFKMLKVVGYRITEAGLKALEAGDG